jgi:hypothetical protein
MPRKIPLKKLLLSALLLCSLPASGWAEEYCFVIVFGSQRPVDKEPQYSHSWGVFIRLYGEGHDLSKYRMEYFTVSWLPCTLQVRVLALFPEPGCNIELHDTIRWALDSGQVIAYWGPYQIVPELYHTAYRRAVLLNSGAVRYKAVESFRNTARVSNCIHALSDLADGHGRLRIGTPAWGHSASYFITMRYTDWMVNLTTHDWIVDCLGLRCYPLCQSDLCRGNPTTRPILRIMQNITQSRR